MACVFCRTGETKDKICSNCGRFLQVDEEITMVYGTKLRDSSVIRYTLTDRYMIIHRCTHFEKSNNGLGLIGGAVVSVVVLTAKEKNMPFGYYGLHELEKIIYPYRNNKFKKNREVKCIFKDGGEFILRFYVENLAKSVAGKMRDCGVTLVDGSNMHFGDTYCQRPFVNEDTLGMRVCSDIAPKIKMMKGNFSAASLGTPPEEPIYQPEPDPKPQTVEQLGLRVLTFRKLQRAGIVSIEDLVKKNRNQLAAMGLIREELIDVENCLAKHDLQLAPFVPPVYNTPVQSQPAPVYEAPKPEPAPVYHQPAPAYEQPKPQPAPVYHQPVPVYEQPKPQPAPVYHQHVPVYEQPKPQPVPVPEEPQVQPVPVPEEPQVRSAPMQEAPVYEAPVQTMPQPPKRDPNMKFCRMCGAKIRRTDIFCLECGTDQR